MYNIIALIGEAGSGKDTIMKEVLKQDFSLHEIISCTTRPMREGEAEGVNYYYLTGEQFGQLVLDNKMLEATLFNNWFYGTSLTSLDSNKINIGVFNPAGIDAIVSNPNVNVKVFYIKASAKNRLLRQLNREDNPDIEEIIRRYKADTADFDILDFDYEIIENNDLMELASGIEKILSQCQG